MDTRCSPVACRHALVVPLLFLAGAWLVTHPYLGIRHDGILYAAQGLKHLHAEVYGGDLFFKYGSQDEFSVFSWAYALGIRQWGLPRASLVTVALGQALWFGASLILARSTLPRAAFPVGATLVISLPCAYGFGGLLQTAESIATPRLFAEGLGILAVACMVRGRHAAALTLVAVSLPLHPLMAIGPASVGILLALMRWRATRRAVWWSLGALLPLGFAVRWLVPEAMLVMDPGWYAVVAHRSPMAAPDAWSLNDWAALIAPPSLLAMALAAAPGDRLRPLGLALVGTGAAGVLLSVLAAGTHWALLIQGQPWRVIWIVAFMAPVFVLRAYLATNPGARATRTMLLGGLPLLVYVREPFVDLGGLLAVVSLVVMAVILQRERVAPSESLRRTAVAWLVLNLALAIGWSSIRGYAHAALAVDTGDSAWLLLRAFLHSLAWILLPAVALWSGVGEADDTAAPRGPAIESMRGLVAMIVLMLGSALWDGRSGVTRSAEDLMRSGMPEFQQWVPPSATLFWQGSVAYPWLMVGRMSYLSVEQAASVLFSRDVAGETIRRSGFTAPLGLSYADLAIHRGAGPRFDQIASSWAALSAACQDPMLDFVVLRRRVVDVAPIGTFAAPDGVVYHLYGCPADRLSGAEAAGDR